MKTGIICACKRELEPFFGEFKITSNSERSGLKIYEGQLRSHDVVAVVSGAGKVNAAIATQLLVDRYNADVVINAGVCGGMDPALKIFDTVIATDSAYHDADEELLALDRDDLSFANFSSDSKLLELSQKAAKELHAAGTIFWGRMVTGDRFIADDGRADIIEKYNPLSVDMETAAMAHVCYVNKVPFIAIRTVTDTSDHSGTEFFEINCAKAAVIAKDTALAVISLL